MSNLSIQLKIVTPEKTILEKEIISATLPTGVGQITILPNHRSYIASIIPGELIFKLEKEEELLLAISGGFIEFHENKLVILADTAERAEEIDLVRAEEGKRKAEALKKEIISSDDLGNARVMAMIQKNAARIRVARKVRSARNMKIDQ